MVRHFQATGLETKTANVSRFALMEDFEAGPLWPEQIGDGGIAILHVNPDLFNLCTRAMGLDRLRRRRVAGCWAWELDVIPPSWKLALRQVDEVWVPSQFIAGGLRKIAGHTPVHVVPHRMDVEGVRLAPLKDPFPAYAGRPIVFFSYDVRSTHARKNPEAVIEAFRRATSDNSDPVLILKVHGEKAWPQSLERLQRAADGCPNIIILQKTFSPEVMKDVMARIDIVISLHRSEGYGLLMAEAMAAAKPVIATGWSGNMDFMTPECSFPIGYRLVPALDPQNTYGGYGAHWAEPNIAEAAAVLKNLLEHPDERLSMGRAAREHIAKIHAPEAWLSTLPDSFWMAIGRHKMSRIITS
jgi:glycosyltransferase involved in cell wall biosynthesis